MLVLDYFACSFRSIVILRSSALKMLVDPQYTRQTRSRRKISWDSTQKKTLIGTTYFFDIVNVLVSISKNANIISFMSVKKFLNYISKFDFIALQKTQHNYRQNCI